MTAGEAAYKKWADLIIPRAVMTWAELPDIAKKGWEEIAEVAITHHQEMHGCCNGGGIQ